MHPSSLKTKITTALLAETRDFYVTLGMSVVEEWREADDVGCILAVAGGGREGLLEISEGSRAGGAFGGLSLQFRTNDLAGFRALLPSGTQVRGPVERPWGSTYLYLTDPNGISVVVFEGGL